MSISISSPNREVVKSPRSTNVPKNPNIYFSNENSTGDVVQI